jgi:hypothetical protein
LTQLVALQTSMVGKPGRIKREPVSRVRQPGLDADETEGQDDLTVWRTTRQNLVVAQATLAYDEASYQLVV